MKRRIIGLILVVAMLTLSLVSCGYSFAKDDLTAYATFSAENKAAFEEALKKILIEDGDFTVDPTTRENKVLDNIYSDLANSADKTDKKTTGVPGARDLVYYCYYVTADFDGTEAVLYASNMNQSNAANIQLGAFDLENVADAVAAAVKNLDFTDKVYSVDTTGSAAEGNVVYVTYTYSYKVTGSDGVETEKSGTMTNDRIVIAAAPAEGEKATSLASYLCGKEVSKSLDKTTITEEGKGEVSYSGIKINWVSKGEELTSFKDVTYADEDKNVTDTTGTSRNLKGKELTYHIYPTHFVSVSEFNATNLIDTILGEDITADIIYELLFGEEYAGLDADNKDDEAKIAERNELVKPYITKDGEKDVTLAALIENIAKLQKEVTEAEEALEDKEEDVTEATEARDKAKDAVDTAGDAATEAQKDSLTKAETNLTNATKARDDAKALLDGKIADKDGKIATLLGITVDGVATSDKLVKGYKITTYNYLQDAYNNEIKMNLATEIYYFLTKNIAVTGTPEDAVKMTYDQMIENYEYEFYKEDYDSSKNISNYKQYNGSFKKFLIAAVTSDIKSVKTYDEAVAAIKEKAAEYVKPIVQIYVASKAYDVVASDKEFKDYKKNPDNNYSYNEYSYGEKSVLYAYQFDKLMNYFLEYEEKTAEADANGYEVVTFEYKKIGAYEFGEPASQATAE